MDASTEALEEQPLPWRHIALLVSQVLLVLLLLRLKAVMPAARARPEPRPRTQDDTHLLIVLGSGGHTAEMLSMLRNAATRIPPSDLAPARPANLPKAQWKQAIESALKPLDWRDYRHRTWVVGAGDAVSAARARDFEAEMAALYAKHPSYGRIVVPAKGGGPAARDMGSYTIATVPRARRIHQPLYTAPVSSLRCLWACLGLLSGKSPEQTVHRYPDLIMVNGPATATVMVAATVVLRFFNWRGADSANVMRTVYVESWARVTKLSLSGRILTWLADRIIVQWEYLHGVEKRGEYLGVLV